MVDDPQAERAAGDEGSSGVTWRKLLGWSALWSVAVVVLINVFGGIIPPLVVFALLWLIGAVWLRRSAKGPAILLLVVSAAFLVMSAPFIVPTLAVPASAGDFVLNVASLIGALGIIVAAVAVLRGRAESSSSTPRALLRAAGALFGLAVILGVVAFATYDDPTAREDDVALTTAEFEFSDDSVEASSGEVAVFVENADATLHTFTIDELDVNLAVPAGKSARVTFEAEPGTYTFYCVPHEYEMKGELQVR